MRVRPIKKLENFDEQYDPETGERDFRPGGDRPPTQVVALTRDPRKRYQRAQRDGALVPEIECVWKANMQVQGADKVWCQLAREGTAVARCTVERFMRRPRIRGVMRGKLVRTTIFDSTVPRPLERVNRQFKAAGRSLRQGRNTPAFATPSAWPRPASSHPWEAVAIATTTLWPRRSTGRTRPS